MIKFKIPARINILGNPSDGVEGDFATISAAVNLYAYARIKKHHSITFTITHPEGSQNNKFPISETFPLKIMSVGYGSGLDILKASFNGLLKYSSEFREKLQQTGFQLTTWSEVPRQSGLGGSSLLVLLALSALREFYKLDKQLHNDYWIAELAQRIEANEMGITCGYADRYVPLFGGLAYLDYHGKLYQKGIEKEPYVTYERLTPLVGDFPLVAVSSGIEHHSGDIHGQMRPIYLKEYEEWIHLGGPPPPMVGFMTAVWETAWKGKIALIRGDIQRFGGLMNKNHTLVDKMMRYCGFNDGAGEVNNLFIQKALEAGALGAKLTGAGGGGSVFSLVKNGEETLIAQAWQEIIEQKELSKAKVFFPKICPQGLLIDYE